MDITSITYLVFVGICLFVYFIVPYKVQWIVLLVESMVFYFLGASLYTFVYVIMTAFSVWGATNLFEHCKSQMQRKVVLLLAMLLNVGLLAVLKYTNLAINTINGVSSLLGVETISNVSLASSLAISFYTLQLVAYLLDIYWGVSEVQRNPLKVLLFTCYFPLMVSGPINSYQEFGKSLFEEHRFDYDRVTHGLKRVALGLMKKLVISNRVAMVVNDIWDKPEVYDGICIWIAAFGFVIQLYTDFSGCMDIVLGVSECFGVNVSENFKAPLMSKTVQEFWQRWHITLGKWLRDYIMNPMLKSEGMVSLGSRMKKRYGKNGKKVPVYISMLVLWLTMGLWHGNSWKYIVGEGLWFWLIIVIGQILNPFFSKLKELLNIKDGKLWTIWSVIRTNLVFMVGMLFFRADSLRDSFYRISISFHMNGNILLLRNVIFENMSAWSKMGCIALFISVIMVIIADVYTYKEKDVFNALENCNLFVRWGIYILVVFMISISFTLGEGALIYAQF